MCDRYKFLFKIVGIALFVTKTTGKEEFDASMGTYKEGLNR